MDRRSYLKLAGATAASAAVASSVATGASDYDVIEVGAGETFRKSLSQGETWANKLIDISARGASYRITATTDNWAIRNVGIRGKLDSTPGSQNFVVYVPSSGATGLIENVYLPGTSYARSSSPFPSGVYVHSRHAGDLEVRGFYAADLPSHGFYGSDPGNRNTSGQGGTVRIHNSYCSDTESSGFRIGTDGSYIENCVSFRTVRGLWSRWGDTEARDCDLGDNSTDIVVGQSGYSQSSTVTVANTRFGDVYEANGSLVGSSAGSPQEYVPEGCPTSAEEAASGSGGQPTVPDDLPENTLTITGQGEPTKYYVETSGELTRNPERGDLQRHDTIDGTTASGWVTRPENVDGYRFDGELVDVGFEQGVATVTVNGQEIDPSEFGDDGGSEPEAEHTLTITGQGEPTTYYVKTTGEIEPDPENGDIEEWDSVDGTTASGWVTQSGHVDGYRFDGELVDVGFDQGEAIVELDGEEVDLLPHTLVIDGTESDGTSTYTFEIDGDVSKSTYRDATVEEDDVVEGTSISGSVDDWLDAYWFEGDIVDLQVNGDANVDIEYNARDQ